MIATVMASKRAFGRGHGPRLARVDRNRRFQRARDALEAGFGDVVAVRPVKRLDMQREPSVAGESLKELPHELGVETADLFGREFGAEYEQRPPRDVDGDPGQRLVHRQETVGVARQPLFVPERLQESLDRKSTRLNSSHANISYAVFCL